MHPAGSQNDANQGCLIRTVGKRRRRENKLKVQANTSKGMASVFWTVKEFC
jgi:hypothetical protein